MAKNDDYWYRKTLKATIKTSQQRNKTQQNDGFEFFFDFGFV